MIGALPAVLAQEPDTEIRVILPWYRAVREKFGEKTERIAEYRVQLGWRDQHVGLLSLRVGKVRMLFLENDYYFDRGSTYGYYDDGERFAWFSLAATEALRQMDWFPDVLHCSDWQTALIPLFLRILSRGNRRFGEVRTLLTIHNAEYQGKAPIEFARDVLGLREEDIPVMRWDGAVNFLKTGIVCSDRVNAVSRRYARELLDPFYAFGLDRILREQESKLCGIVNGIDTELYDPRRDPVLTANYSRENPVPRRENKAALQRELGLAVRPDMPLLAMVTRLVSHKGIDLAEQAIPALIDDFPLQFVVLGTGEERYENTFCWWSKAYPERFSARLCFDEALSRRVYAGADMILMPSIQEPCGLTQLVAMRYGAVPIVRKTGGLADTVSPYDPVTGEGLGFVFENCDAESLIDAVQRACTVYKEKKCWDRLCGAVMSVDSSWDKSAREYLRLYRELL